MPVPKQKTYTIDDIYNLPNGERAELIDGQIYYMAPPTRTHQRLVLSLSRKIADYIDSNNGICEVNVSPFAVFLNADDKRYLEPDVFVVCDKDKLDDKGCHGAPDWVIEVVSPGSREMDYYIKLALYKEAGVRLYWLVDIERQTIVVYDLEHEAIPALYHFTDSVSVGIYSDFKIDFSNMDAVRGNE